MICQCGFCDLLTSIWMKLNWKHESALTGGGGRGFSVAALTRHSDCAPQSNCCLDVVDKWLWACVSDFADYDQTFLPVVALGIFMKLHYQFICSVAIRAPCALFPDCADDLIYGLSKWAGTVQYITKSLCSTRTDGFLCVDHRLVFSCGIFWRMKFCQKLQTFVRSSEKWVGTRRRQKQNEFL